MLLFRKELDQLCDQVKKEIPDADLIVVGRMRMETAGPTRDDDRIYHDWHISFHLPRRGKNKQILRGTEVFTADGDTFADALDKAKFHAHYHRTGKLPEK